jgi:C1A family cysteine protease
MLSFLRHEPALKALPPINAASWDSRTMGWIGPPKDQAQCGSCWDFSGTCVVEVACYKAGILAPDGSQALSEEYTLSCGRNGGCNGDDNTTVLSDAKAHGLPLTSAYGQYSAGGGKPTKCVWVPTMKLYRLTDWGFCDSNGGQGITATQDIKNCIAAYGCVGAAIAADDAFMNIAPGTVFQGSGSTEIDHDIVLIGWDDSKGAWLLRNSWGASWCDGGYCWIKYRANCVGTESVFGFVTAAPAPPPGPGPVPGPSLPAAVAELDFRKTGIVKGHTYMFVAPHGAPPDIYGLVAGAQGGKKVVVHDHGKKP